MDNLKLTVEKNPKHPKNMKFCVDDPTAPGSPFVGYGATIAEAVGNWVIGNAQRTNIRLSLTTEAQAHVNHSNAIKLGRRR